jgi:hypothetical protein
MSSTPSPDPKLAGVVALEISVATVRLAVDDLMEKASELADPLCSHWIDVGTTIRETLATALAGHEQQYAPWPRPAPSHIKKI